MARILLVDDSLTDLHLIGGWIQALGHEFVHAGDADSGIAMAREGHPDLILMDVVMPGRNGFEATRILHRDPATQAIPVVIISTKTQPTDIAWGKRQGAVAYLPKPFSQQDLARALAQAGIGA